MVIFEVVSVLRKKIKLTEIQWTHILLQHGEIHDQLDKVKETIIDPDFVLFDEEEDNFQYYKFYDITPVTAKYMLVIVKHLNTEGFIITTFFTRKVKKVEVVWSKK